MKKSILATAVVAALGITATYTAEAAALPNGDWLSITAGSSTISATNAYGYVTSGSWFSMQGSTAPADRTALSQGVQGLVIGTAQNYGGAGTYSGDPIAGDVSNITAPWTFLGNTGKNYTTSAVTGSTTGGLDLSGWAVTWNGIAAIGMGSEAWTPTSGYGSTETYSNGVANITWDGVVGDSYTLDYAATVPAGSPTGFGGTPYYLHLTGDVMAGPAAAPAPNTVPIPAAAWLFGSGLVGLLGVVRRKKSV